MGYSAQKSFVFFHPQKQSKFAKICPKKTKIDFSGITIAEFSKLIYLGHIFGQFPNYGNLTACQRGLSVFYKQKSTPKSRGAFLYFAKKRGDSHITNAHNSSVATTFARVIKPSICANLLLRTHCNYICYTSLVQI